MKSFGLLIAAATLTLTSAAQADTCSQRDITRTATMVLDTNRTLSALPVPEDKQTEVSPAGRKAISTMKDRLNDYTFATMRCAPKKIGAKDLQKTLAGFAGVKLPQSGPARKPAANEATYGGEQAFDVRMLSPDTLGVSVRFGIACGEDTMLMIFERRNNAWVETLRTQSTPYNKISGGWWAFDYGAARDKDRHWFIVTKNVAPWCSSTWSEIRYSALRPGADATHPRTLLSKSDSIWWSDDMGILKVDAKGFDLRWRAESMDGDVHNREWIARYDIEDDRVVRAAPIAEGPRDFADEWVRLDWKEAKDWTAVASYGLRPLHDQLRKQHYFTYQSARRCSDGDHTQIEVEPVEGDKRHVFFQVFGTKVLQMGDVGFKPESVCKGPNQFDMNLGK
jgi:hypothetical protein